MIVLLVTFLLSTLLCGAYLRFARARQIFAIPNERSSHSLPTPHGGGVALLTAFLLGLLLARLSGSLWDVSFIHVGVAALVLMLLGVVDDLKGLSVRLRMMSYGLVCVWAAGALLQSMDFDSGLTLAALVLLAALTMLWSLNLYNFMDGIDGIAALQCVLACCFAAWLSGKSGHNDDYALFCLLLAAAHAGFLVWNFPPARLFMGDAGSIPTGFLLASIALVGAVQGQLDPLCWLVLLAVFIADTGWTLLWRLCTGQAFMQPHRLHAYQRLSRHWGSHISVDSLVVAINALWLFPLAWAVQAFPDYSLILVILAYLPLLCGMAKIGKLT